MPRAGTLNISIFVSFSEMLKLSVPSAFSKLEYFSVAKIIVNENSSAKGGRRKLFGGFSSEVKKNSADTANGDNSGSSTYVQS